MHINQLNFNYLIYNIIDNFIIFLTYDLLLMAILLMTISNFLLVAIGGYSIIGY
jgi:hypothetical protein